MPGNCIIIQTRTESPKRAPSSITNDISYISFFCLHKTWNRLNYRSVDYSTIKNFVFNVTKDIRLTDIPTWKQKLEQQYINLAFDPAVALSDLSKKEASYLKKKKDEVLSVPVQQNTWPMLPLLVVSRIVLRCAMRRRIYGWHRGWWAHCMTLVCQR